MDSLKQLSFSLSAKVVPWSTQNSSSDNSESDLEMNPVSSPKQIEPKEMESPTVLQTKADNQASKKLDVNCIREYWTQLNLFEIDPVPSPKIKSQISPKSVETYNNTKALLNEFDIQPTSSSKQISPKSVGESENTEKTLESIDKREIHEKILDNKSNGRDYWIGLNQHFGSDKQIMVNCDTIDGYNELTENNESIGGIHSLYSTPSASCIDLSINENESTRSTSYMDSLKQLLFSLSAKVVPWSTQNSSSDNSVKKRNLMTPFTVSQTSTAPKITEKGEFLKSTITDISALKVTQSEPPSRVISHHSESTILNDTRPSVRSMPETANDDVISPTTTESRLQNNRRLMPPRRRFARHIVHDQSKQNEQFQKLTEWVGQGYERFNQQNTQRFLFG